MRKLLAFAVLGCSATLSFAAAQNAPGLAGAYVGPGHSCADVFVFRNGQPSFKSPRNAFASAILVRGKTISTPMATCRLGRMSNKDGVATLDLTCTNMMSSDGVKAYLRRQDDGSLVRLSDPNDTSGDSYQRCNP